MSKKITDEELIQNLLDLKEKLGRNPKKEDLKVAKGSKYGYSAYKRAFGNFENILKAANLQANERRNVSNEEILNDITMVYKELGRTPSRKDYIKMGKTYKGFSPIKKRFGSWTNVLIEAGIPIANAGKVNKSFILNELKKWYIKNNYDSKCLSYWTIRKAKQNNKFSISEATIKNHFPDMSWEQIMQQIASDYQTQNQFYKRSSYLGNDGNEYLSLLELEAANHLFFLQKNNSIAAYEYEKLVCPEERWTCDFVVTLFNGQELWLEMDGMRNNRRAPYSGGNNEKIQYYVRKNINYFVLSYNNSNIKESINMALGIEEDFVIGGKKFSLSSPIAHDFIFFNREELYDYHIAHGSEAVLVDLVIPFYNFLLRYIERYGWIYPPESNDYMDMLDVFRKKKGVFNSSNNIGTTFIKGHFKSFWHCSTGKNKINPLEATQNKDIMLRLLKYSFGISKSKLYHYKFGDREIEFNELFNIGFKRVITALNVNRYVVSIFKPLLAKYVYQKYGFSGMRTWDPCAGFASRMLGFLGAFDEGLYIACEPNSEAFKELYKLADKLGQLDRVELHNVAVEEHEVSGVDFVFTCPPYDFKEHYCDEENQSDVRYKDRKKWVNGFLVSLMKKSYLSLRPGGRCVIVFDYKNLPDCIKIAQEVGFKLEDTLSISNQKTHLNPSLNVEFCLVFQK